jgi:hypothetical protein
MKSYLKTALIFVLLLSAVNVYSQEKTKKEGKQALTKADSLKMAAAAKDTVGQKAAIVRIYKKISTKSPLSNNAEGYIINKDEIYKTDYRSIGDLFYNIPFGFQQYVGSAGLYHEAMLYGNGFGAVSFADDGISVNNRLFNSYDLNNFQSEKIDSIEIYSLPKAFIFNTMNSNSAFNFISKERLKDKQYSRLRFVQGSNKEGFIDFIFNMSLAKNFFITSEITNNNIVDRYLNSEAGGWRGMVKLNYLLSDKVNLTANYNYVNTETKFNGGVNLDALKEEYPTTWQDYLYEEKRAPVNFENRGQKVLNHSIAVKATAELIHNDPADLTFYYQTGLNEFRQNDTVDTYYIALQRGVSSIRDDNKYTTYGFLLNQGYSDKYFGLKLIMNYEKSKYDTPLLPGETERGLFSIAGIAALHLIDSTVHPSFFIKQLNYNSNSYFGLGGDINIALLKNIFIYSGYSYYDKPYNILEEISLSATGKLQTQSITNFETGIRYINKSTDIRLSYFNTKNNNAPFTVFSSSTAAPNYQLYYLGTAERTAAGINTKFTHKYWKILFSGNATSLLNSDAGLVNNPKFTFDGGIYFVDTLFNKNLDLKAGFSFKYYASQNYFIYDFEKSMSAQVFITGAGSSNYAGGKTADVFRIDFFLAGKVQESAIVYFTFENLFDTKYYIVPFYPALGRNIRFGISWEFLD